jgi:hypothetical protein
MTTQIAPEKPLTAGQVQGQTAAPLASESSIGRLVALKRRRRMDRAHRTVARIVLGGITVQVFLAGLGIFTTTGFLPHIIWGTAVILASFSLPVLALMGHLERTVVRLSWLLAGLMVVQGALIDVGRIFPVVAAFHPVNAMALVLVAFLLATRHIEG